MKRMSDVMIAYATQTALRKYVENSEYKEWLSPQEREVLQSFRSVRRQDEWFCGRILAKRLIQQGCESQQNQPFSSGLDVRLPQLRLSPAQVTIISQDGRNRGVRPQVFLAGRLQPWSLSITHANNLIMAGFSPTPNVQVGVDLVPTVDFGRGFAAAWLTDKEREWLHTHESKQTSLFWGMKEAIYKATNVGEPFVPRQIEISPDAETGKTSACRVRGLPLKGLSLDITRIGEHTVVVARCRTENSVRNLHSAVSRELRYPRCSSRLGPF